MLSEEIKDHLVKESKQREAGTPPRFKPGDLVYLKSGGHHMTVGSISGDMVSCDWHDPAGTPHRADYNETQLLPSPLKLPEQAPIQLQPTNEDWRDKRGL